MTRFDQALEEIRVSFGEGETLAMRFRQGLTPHQMAYAEASLRLIDRGYVDEYWHLTDAGRAWAFGDAK